MAEPTQFEPCPGCDGAGFVDSMDPDIPIKPCNHCNGSGRVAT